MVTCKRCGKKINEDISADHNGISDDRRSDTEGNGHIDAQLGDYEYNIEYKEK